MTKKRLTKQEIEVIKEILDRQANRRVKRKQNIAAGYTAETRTKTQMPMPYEDCELLLTIIRRTHGDVRE